MEKINRFTLTGTIVWLGVAYQPGNHITQPVESIRVFVGHGIHGDNHAGSRLADAREAVMVKLGLKESEIPNLRHFSAVSVEEIQAIREVMGLPAEIPYGLLGENIIFEGIPNLTQLPPGTLLSFKKNETTQRHAVLAVWGENTPCLIPGQAIADHFGIENLAKLFPQKAIGKRGIVGFVYCSGKIGVGDIVTAHIPIQTLYVKPD